jgi:hypothetical protein
MFQAGAGDARAAEGEELKVVQLADAGQPAVGHSGIRDGEPLQLAKRPPVPEAAVGDERAVQVERSEAGVVSGNLFQATIRDACSHQVERDQVVPPLQMRHAVVAHPGVPKKKVAQAMQAVQQPSPSSVTRALLRSRVKSSGKWFR